MEVERINMTTNDDYSQIQSVRLKVNKAFKTRGLSIQTQAVDALLNVLQREEASSFDRMLKEIIDEVKSRLMSSESDVGHQIVVTKSVLAEVVAEWSRDSTDVVDESLQLLDAFYTPKLVFNHLKREFILRSVSNEESSLFGEATDKIDMFLQRYFIVQQRLARNERFRSKIVAIDDGHSSGDGQLLKITPIDGLLGRSGNRLLMGILRQIEENNYYLEDDSGLIPINLNNAEVLSDGFILENSFYLAEGEVVDGIFRVDKIGLPVSESRSESMNAVGLQNCDIFGAFPSLSEYVKVQEQECVHGEEGAFAVFSDVHLDRPDVLAKLEEMFKGFQNLSPLPVFVLMGNFTSKPMSSSMTKSIIGYFDELGNIISQFPNIAQNGRFIIVPGPNDPGMGSILPHQPIPEYFTAGLRSKVQRLVLTSNPCRIRYFTKEFVFFRQDMAAKFLQHSIFSRRSDMKKHNGMEDGTHSNQPLGNKRLFTDIVQTVIHQSHLCPLPEVACPTYWQYDHVMRLFPLPDALILGDRMEQMYENYIGCDVINTGPFIRDFSFVLYHPIAEGSTSSSIKSDVEFSQI